jgi:hypothetical protein
VTVGLVRPVPFPIGGADPFAHYRVAALRGLAGDLSAAGLGIGPVAPPVVSLFGGSEVGVLAASLLVTAVLLEAAEPASLVVEFWVTAEAVGFGAPFSGECLLIVDVAQGEGMELCSVEDHGSPWSVSVVS